MGETYGPYVRLWGIHPSQLLAETASPQDLTPFLSAILAEAVPFVASVPSSSEKTSSASPSGPWKATGRKTFQHSTAPVYMYERIVSAEDLRIITKEHKLPQVAATSSIRPEAWCLRRSVHEDAGKAGTASWEEWLRCFKEGHADAELKFTPTVLKHTLKKEWDCSGAEISLGEDVFENLTLKVEESVHKMPAPLKNRVFPVVQVTAAVRGRREFLVVQVAAVPENAAAEGSRPDGAFRATYTSIERFKDVGGNVEWLMGTVSDARGVLPAWVQKMAVPGQIAKDVDMFLEWIIGERKSGVN